MFHNRSSEFDPRISAIAGHLRAIEGELSAIGKSATRRASAGAAATGNQVADAIGPILNDIAERFRRSQRSAVDEAGNFGNEAVKIGAKVGNDVLERFATQAKYRPLATLAVAIGVGVLVGIVSQRH
jgi:hypothetical protein